MAGRIDRPEPRRGARSLDLGARPQQPGEPGRTDNDRGGQLEAEQLDRLVARRGSGEERRNELHCGQRRLVAAHGDLVAGGAVNQVEQQPRQLLAGKRAQRRDAVTFAFERGLIHQTPSRYALIALSRKSLRLSAAGKPAVAQSSVVSHCR